MNDFIKSIGKTVTERYGTSDPFIIADEAGIPIRYVPFDKEPLGQAINFHGQPMILISDTLKYSRERYFVCAHELGHAIEHEDLAGYYTSNNHNKGKIEVEADKFAVVLLSELYVEENDEYPHNWSDLVHAYGFPSWNGSQII